MAQVKDARYDTCSRNVLQHADLKDAVQLGRVDDHFICKYSQIEDTYETSTVEFDSMLYVINNGSPIPGSADV